MDTGLIVFDSKIVEENQKLFEKWNIRATSYDKFNLLFENVSASDLQVILTSDQYKTEMLTWLKNNYLLTTKLYVFNKDVNKLKKEDEDNPAIFMTSISLETLLESIKKKNQSMTYNPLALINREMKVKVHVKIIEYDTNNKDFWRLYSGLVGIGSSVQVCVGFESYNNSMLFSTSDVVVCRAKCREASDYPNKPAGIIFYDAEQNTQFNGQSVESLIKMVKDREFKSGYRTEPIRKVFIINQRSNKHS